MLIPINEQDIKDIVEINTAKEVGIFISLLSYEYMKKYDITKEDIFKSLENSFNILKSNEKKKELDNHIKYMLKKYVEVKNEV